GNVYPRRNVPDARLDAVSRSTKGALMARDDEIRATARPAERRSIRKFRPVRAGLYSRPACRKASGVASFADSEEDSSGAREVISTSACSGWPSADWTVRRPSPA